MAIVTTQDVKQYLLGLEQHLSDALPDGGESLIEGVIEATEREFERRTGILLSPQLVRTFPTGIEGVDFDREQTAMTLHKLNSNRFPSFKLEWRPVIEVISVRLQWGPNNIAHTFPESNLRVNKRLGVIDVVPFHNLAGIAAGSGFLFTLINRGGWPNDNIPLFVAVDYRAGYQNADTLPRLADLRDAICEKAAADVLGKARSLVPNSVNLDGFSQQFDSVQQRIENYDREWEKFLKNYQARERPLVAGWI